MNHDELRDTRFKKEYFNDVTSINRITIHRMYTARIYEYVNIYPCISYLQLLSAVTEPCLPELLRYYNLRPQDI